MENENKTTIKADGIYAAIFNVQQSVSTYIKANAINPRFSKDGKKTYADLHAIMEVLAPVLGANKVLLMQSITSDCIETTMYHVPSGQSIVKEHKIDMSRLDIQQVGSYTTYMRRYTICSLLGIAIDKDDDDAESVSRSKLTVKSEKKTLSDDYMKSKTFTDHINRCINEDGMTLKQVLDKIKESYTITPSQETTILNLKP